jgi:hypothetical protein
MGRQILRISYTSCIIYAYSKHGKKGRYYKRTKGPRGDVIYGVYLSHFHLREQNKVQTDHMEESPLSTR